MNIVHAGPASDVTVLSRFGGAVERRILELARRQVEAGDTVVIYTSGDSDSVTHFEGIEICTLQVARGVFRQLEFQWRVVRALRSRGSSVEVVHWHGQPEGAILDRRIGAASILSYDNF